jgi:hypothetical protein
MSVNATNAKSTRHSASTRGGTPRSKADFAIVPPKAKNAALPRAAT